jgi:hypothetical protein
VFVVWYAGSGLCDELITRSENPTVCVCVCACVCVCVCVFVCVCLCVCVFVFVCGLKTPTIKRLRPELCCCATVEAFRSLRDTIHISTSWKGGTRNSLDCLRSSINAVRYPIYFVNTAEDLNVTKVHSWSRSVNKTRQGQQRRRKNTVHYREGWNFIAVLYCSVFLSNVLRKWIFYQIYYELFRYCYVFQKAH